LLRLQLWGPSSHQEWRISTFEKGTAKHIPRRCAANLLKRILCSSWEVAAKKLEASREWFV